MHALLTAAQRRPVVVISTDSGGMLDFTSPDEIDAGYAAAEGGPRTAPRASAQGNHGLPSGLDEFQVLRDLDSEDQ